MDRMSQMQGNTPPRKHSVTHTSNPTVITQNALEDLKEEYNVFFLDARIWMWITWIVVIIAFTAILGFSIYFIYLYANKAFNAVNTVNSALQAAANILVGVVVKLIFSQKKAAIANLRSCSERCERQQTSYSHWEHGNAMVEIVRASGLPRKAQDDLVAEIIRSLLAMQHDDEAASPP